MRIQCEILMHKIACVFVAIVVAAGVSLQPTNKQQQHKLLATSTHGKKKSETK